MAGGKPSKAISGLLGREYLHAVLTRETGLTSRPSPPSAGPCAPEAFWCCWCRRSPSGPTGPTGILCAGATAQSRSPPRTLFTTFAGCLPPIQMPSSGINIVLCAFPLRQIYPRQPASGEPQREQAEILDALLTMPAGVAAVTAPRGRESPPGGHVAERHSGECSSDGTGKGATDVIARFAGEHFHFMAPDALLASTTEADWLIVDEAAAIPGPLLEKLVSRFPRVLLTTTVQGYEGTGRDSC